FTVNSITTYSQGRPSIAIANDGSFVVVWESTGTDGDGVGISGRRFASGGGPLGADFVVNTFTTGQQRFPSTASDAAGNFVVAWMSRNQDGSNYGTFAQRYGSDGSPLGAEFRVNSYTTDVQAFPSVASGSDGSFVVAWTSRIQDGTGNDGIFGQRYDTAGTP